jgi:hypothetical protein
MNQLTLALECDSGASSELSIELEAASNNPVISAEKKHLDGSPATTLQIVQIAISTIAAIAPIVAAFIANRSVKKIKLGAIEIENPTKEQWETLWKQHLAAEQSTKD